MGIINGEKRECDKCDVEIKNKKVEPKESISRTKRKYQRRDCKNISVYGLCLPWQRNHLKEKQETL
jgi:hypothetical protein